MKKRLVIWTFLISAASIATAVSFRMPVPHHIYTKAEQANALGVSVDEMLNVHKRGARIGSDIHFHRPVNEKDIQFIFSVADKCDKLGASVIQGFIMMKGTPYEARATEIAFKATSSADENIAYTGMSQLKYFNDSRWVGLALSYPWKSKDYQTLLIDPEKLEERYR
jgi:hypothetical protein